ncbi:hypothetical protein DFH08DRAFT_804805 [Mycena albidolilacea]|uniref:Uncharacterized protein n=1 Tax=Mycena albidolilacea TaxID=1033008 RepID=A0AAD7AA94_9AGAR|nr:hypothetical protein DFH08DRAFT_804805 [Mycena albidolilacea]
MPPYTFSGPGPWSGVIDRLCRQPLDAIGQAGSGRRRNYRNQENSTTRKGKWCKRPSKVIGIREVPDHIQTRLLEARSVKKWGEYLKKVKGILQSIDECAKEVKDIQTSILLTIEAKRQRQLCEGIKEVCETINATICSSMRHERTLTLRRRFESENGNTFDGPSMRVYQT